MSRPLAADLADPDPEVRSAACRRAVDDPAAALLLERLAGALGDADRRVARAASDALAELARRVGGVPEVLRRGLDDQDPARRFGAALTLARVEPPGLRLIPVLVENLRSAEGAVRWRAAKLLVDAGRLHAEVLPLLLGLARVGDDARVRRMASYCLRELAPDRPEACDALLAASHDSVPDVRRAAFTALAALCDPPARVATRLADALRSDPDPGARRIAALALGELGAAGVPLPAGAREALEALTSAAGDAGLARASRVALGRLAGR